MYDIGTRSQSGRLERRESETRLPFLIVNPEPEKSENPKPWPKALKPETLNPNPRKKAAVWPLHPQPQAPSLLMPPRGRPWRRRRLGNAEFNFREFPGPQSNCGMGSTGFRIIFWGFLEGL